MKTEELSAPYQPRDVEKRIYEKWLAAGAFHAVPLPRGGRFSMVIPPPNVTGALHLGHAINGTIQDILARYHRMKGDNTLWMPGIDHAGIATQAVVEKTIFQEEKKNRHDLGREELVKRIWQWKEKFGNRILDQLKAMGASCDWERTRFTLDKVCARAVRAAFFKLFKDGLIFCGRRLVNWDTHLQTAVADDEIYHETVQGQMTSIKYPLANRKPGEPEYLIVATTRPETMLGDTAVAVHPNDPRYQNLIGRHVELPLVGRKIPIIADGLLVDPKFGTGVVKVTPAHDPNDYACGLRHNLQQINLLTPDGKVHAHGKGRFRDRDFDYRGLKFASDARKKVLEDLESLGLIADQKPHEHEVGHSDRSKTPIEPYLSEQWFVKMGDVEGGITLGDGTKAAGLAQAAIDAVQDGRVKIIPERYTQGYIDWLSQKRDWCISRQLWWGHGIPVRIRTISFDPTQSLDNTPIVEMAGDDLERAKKGAELWEAFVAAKGLVEDVCVKPRRTLRELQEEIARTGGYTYASQVVLVARTEEADRCITEFDEKCLGRAPATGSGPSLDTEEQTLFNKLSKIDYRPGSVESDPDVLDTWFSSALWPLSTMGWPAEGTNEKPEDGLLTCFYPTDVLSTAREILTLWVARMVMFGLYLHGDVPFKKVYIHAVIQDGQGRPMKKSLGNGVDPVDIIESHGADALRYTLASMATETQDIRLPVVKDKSTGKNTSPRFDIGRNFANKIWNASRFILANTSGVSVPSTPDVLIWESLRRQSVRGDTDRPIAPGNGTCHTTIEVADRWILSRLHRTIQAVEETINAFRFAPLATTLYEFFWNDLCDWYLEIAKNRLRQQDRTVQTILLYALDTGLRLLHPLMPFISEAIWERLPGRGESLMVSPFPKVEPELFAPDAERQIALAQGVTRKIRDIRNQYNLAPKRTLDVVLSPASESIVRVLAGNQGIIEPLSNSTLRITQNAAPPSAAAVAVLPEVQIYVLGVIDREAEIKRLGKRKSELEHFIRSSQAKLANGNFVDQAPASVVQGWRDQLARQESELAAVKQGLAELLATGHP